MKTSYRVLSALGLGLLTSAHTVHCFRLFPVPKKLSVEHQETPDYLYPVDIDGDGTDEVIRGIHCPGLHAVMVQDLQHNCISSVLNTPDSLQVSKCLDLDGDGHKEVFFGYNKGDSSFVVVYDWHLSRPALARFRAATGQDIGLPEGWDGNVGVCGLTDVAADGGLDIVGVVATGWDCYPRGISAYEWSSGEEIWHFPMGTCPLQASVVEVTGDTQPEVVVTTWAPCNGGDANGTNDFHSYVIVLNSGGQCLWMREIGGPYSFLSSSVGDVDGDGRTEIVVAETDGEREKPEGYRLLVLDGETGDTENQLSFPERFLNYKSVVETEDLNRDGKDEIVVGSRDGRLRVFNGRLEVIREYIHSASVDLRELVDLDADTIPELLLSTGDGCLLVLSHRLREILQYKLEEPDWQVIPVSAGKEKKLLLRTGELWRWMRIENRTFLGLNLVWLAGSGYAAGFLLLVGLSIVTSKTLVSRRRSRLKPPPIDVLRAIEDDFIREGKKKIITLRTALTELESGQVTEGLLSLCRESFEDFRGRYNAHRTKLDLFGPRGHSVSASISQSLEVLGKSLPSISDPRTRLRVVGRMIAATDALLQDVTGEMLDEVTRYRYGIADALHEGIKTVKLEKEKDLADFSILIKEKLPEGPSPKDIYYEDYEKWKHIFSNVIRNSVEATVTATEGEAIGPERKVVDVRLNRTYDKGWRDVIVIEDRGCGMDEETRANFWRRGFSKGKAGSMGVGVTPKTVEFIRHHGDFSVVSEVGKGTKFIIEAGPKGR